MTNGFKSGSAGRPPRPATMSKRVLSSQRTIEAGIVDMGILSELEVNPSADLPSAMPPQRHASSSYSDDLDHHAGQTHESSSGEKRARGSIACDICRNRKLKCDGNRPCHRCSNEPGSSCTYSVLPRRTALTRARMTELENRLDLHEIIWNVAFPTISLREAEDLALSDRTMRSLQARLGFGSGAGISGVGAVAGVGTRRGNGVEERENGQRGVEGEVKVKLGVDEGLVSFCGGRGYDERGFISTQTSSRTTPGPSPPPSSHPIDPAITDRSFPLGVLPNAMASSSGSMVLTSSTHGKANSSAMNGMPGMSMQMTRLPSFTTTTRGDEAGDLEWQEEQDRGNGQPRLDGMVSLAREDSGTSYLGLSSGATFLHAIRKLYEDAHPGVLPDIFTIQTANTPETRASVDGSTVGEDSRTSAGMGMSGTGGARRTGRVGDPVVLPPLAETMPLIESYFKYFHTLTPIVHEPTIRAQLLGAVPTNKKQGSEVLLYMIFAMGAFDRADRESVDDGWRYYEKAKEALAAELFAKGTLQLVQGVAIMSNYLQRNNRPNAGYLCLGLALRMGIALGLHVSGDESKMTLLEAQTRRRVWWTLAALEAGCSITFGRPFGLGRLRSSSCYLPMNCSDEQITVSTNRLPTESTGPTLYSALIVQARLACVMSDIHSSILQANPAPTYDQIRRYDARVLAVVQAMPKHMKDSKDSAMGGPGGSWYFAKSVTMWRIRDFRAILYRPILLTAAWDSMRHNELSVGSREAIGICRALAIENLEEISLFALLDDPMVGSRGAQWYLLFFAFQSALTLLLSVVWEPDHVDVEGWGRLLGNTAAWFRRCSSIQTLGDSFANIIESILHNHNQTPTDLGAFLNGTHHHHHAHAHDEAGGGSGLNHSGNVNMGGGGGHLGGIGGVGGGGAGGGGGGGGGQGNIDLTNVFPINFPPGYLGVSANPVSIENWSDWFQAFGHDPSLTDPAAGGVDLGFAPDEWQM